jgi:caffeoyl-CoA O-methyltransferase
MELFSKEKYMESLYPIDSSLEQIKSSIREQHMPEISIAEGYGKLLTMLVKMNRCKQVLEIGALGGYSGLCLVRGLSAEGKLISLEINQSFAQLAEQNVTLAGYGHQVEYRVGEAFLLLQELKSQQARFDLIFIDADKINYPMYLEMAIQLANPNAVIVGDNTFMKGQVLDPEVQKASVQAMRDFNHRIANDPLLESTILPAYDGLAIARLKS